jgi:2-polyprenyl-6-methoxyphenol hydroxylase-like FAD-dependent oxidoreductase
MDEQANNVDNGSDTRKIASAGDDAGNVHQAMLAKTAEPRRPAVAIVGGGLGGLVLAHMLREGGMPATVYERDEAAESRLQGYIIGLTEEGVAALERVSFPSLQKLLDESIHSGEVLNCFTLTDALLSPFTVLRMPGRACGLNRSKLREILAAHGPPLDIHWNKRLLRYEDRGAGAGVVLHFDDGTTAEAEVVVGADGAKSLVRSQRCPQLTLQDTHTVNIGGVAPIPDAANAPRISAIVRNSMARAFGANGSSVLFMPWTAPDGARKVIWALTQSDDVPGARDAATAGSTAEQVIGYCKHQLELGGFHEELHGIIASTDHASIHRGGHLFSIVWPPDDNPLGHTTNVTLLGDAAHAMTTHMGLGANTALNDAVDLGDALKAADWRAALAAYEAKMMRRGLTNAKNSLWMTHTITASSFTARVLRRAMFVMFGSFTWLASLFASRRGD